MQCDPCCAQTDTARAGSQSTALTGQLRDRSITAGKAAARMLSATKTLLIVVAALAWGRFGKVAAAGGRDPGFARGVLGSMRKTSRSLRRGIEHGLTRSGPNGGEQRERSLSPASPAERFLAVAAVVENLALFKRWMFKQSSQLEMTVRYRPPQ